MKQKPSERILELARKLVQGKPGMFVSDYIPLATLQYLDEQARDVKPLESATFKSSEQKDTETGKEGDAI